MKLLHLCQTQGKYKSLECPELGPGIEQQGEVWVCVSFGRGESVYCMREDCIILGKGVAKLFIYKEKRM